MVNSKKKGNLWENRLSAWFVKNGIKANQDSASGGGNREKGDIINNLDMTIESKAGKNISLMDWWGQVSRSAEKHHNKPVLFIHQDGMGAEDWLVVMNNEDWLDLVLKENGVKNDYLDPKFKWALVGLSDAIKRVLKFIENI